MPCEDEPPFYLGVVAPPAMEAVAIVLVCACLLRSLVVECDCACVLPGPSFQDHWLCYNEKFHSSSVFLSRQICLLEVVSPRLVQGPCSTVGIAHISVGEHQWYSITLSFNNYRKGERERERERETERERDREREREREIKCRHGAKQREATQRSTRSTANKN